ncbi:MAG: ABC transporter ATP-binding protein [Kiritimatiellia bacterium]|jgi:ABC-type Fe3+/spermidine/putrescine transport system ATPase subunit|nr:ABC transporter ATP-binding protein [Kiritimatiellia bacterium]MDP6847298.1 ABC transporter ATP-binding protein [Kiritimatiellia bacterium]
MLRIEGLETVAGDFRLQAVDLAAPGGSYGVLLGPPGSGKSILVETICGLRRPTAGRILIDDVDVSYDDPRDRLVGYVPQDYVLFPGKRVAENIAFGLRSRGMSRHEAMENIKWVVDLLHIGSLLDRWPKTLSGGEQQRVALARALAIKPRLLLLDEPVSALDEGLRERVCRELRLFQRELGITTIHISHNIEEALAVSDWAAVLNKGQILQHGPMNDLLRHPRSETVAHFLRSENIFSGEAQSASGGHSFITFPGGELDASCTSEGPVKFVIRPELIMIGERAGQHENVIPARLTEIADRGAYMRLVLEAGTPITIFTSVRDRSPALTVGETYNITIPPDSIHVLEG